MRQTLLQNRSFLLFQQEHRFLKALLLYRQDQNKDQQNKNDQNKDQQQQHPQQQQGKISKEDAERLLEALQNDEKNVQEKVQKQKAQEQKAKKMKIEKDW